MASDTSIDTMVTQMKTRLDQLRTFIMSDDDIEKVDFLRGAAFGEIKKVLWLVDSLTEDDPARAEIDAVGREYNDLAKVVRRSLKEHLSPRAAWILEGGVEAVERLAEVEGSAAVDALLEHDDSRVRTVVVRALARRKDPSLASVFGRAFSDDDSAVSEAAADGLIAIGQPAVQVLITYLHSDRWGLRRRAVDALKVIGGEEAQDALTELRQTEQDSDILRLLASD